MELIKGVDYLDEILLGVGKIPLVDMCRWLDQRCYSKDLATQYIRDIYGVNVTKEIEQYKFHFEINKDIFTYFDEKYPTKVQDDKSREWFNSYGRARYKKFYSHFVENNVTVYDEIFNFSQDSSVIHHIYPLMHGGTSNPKNLIGLMDCLHSILHNNPLEHIEKYCYQSVDYLRTLIKCRSTYLYDKYKLEQYDDMDFRSQLLKLAIETEMNDFYKLILEKYSKIGDTI